MPLVAGSTYSPPFLFKNRHVQTIYPALTRKVKGVDYERERLELQDGDFLDLDWLYTPTRRVVILLHGLEGNAERSYIKGMARAFHRTGWNVLAMNFRGCSGETNRLLRSYHAGATEDLRAVIHHILTPKKFDYVGLVGFSLGGNMLLKYLGEEARSIPSQVLGAVAYSVPCDLKGSVDAISAGSNKVYMRNFLKQLHKKMVQKNERYPQEVDVSAYGSMTNFYEFDNRYTAPIHGFKDADEYWRINSCNQFLTDIDVPTLIVNARDDPFLNETCFPAKAASSKDNLYLEVPDFGGHVGFISMNRDKIYWSEQRALQFFSEVAPTVSANEGF